MATSALRFTVAIPTCNGTAHLTDTLDSVLGQRGVDFDLIVSDDCSEDGTPDLIRQRAGSRAKVVVNERRLGLAGNWNQCVALCRTPLIAIVHQDDVLSPDHLAGHLGAFDRDDRIGLVASASTVIDEQGREVPPVVVGRGGLGPADRDFAPGELLHHLVEGNPLRCSAVSIRVAAHGDVGGFDPSLRYVLDWDFWIRVSRLWRVAWHAEPTVRVRWHAASETHRFRTGRADLDETRRVLDSLELELEHDPLHGNVQYRRGVRKLARAFLNRAHDALKGGQIALARECLDEALRLSPGVVTTILADPRLAIQMASLRLAPALARRWFRRSE